jgi:hypothetical protein
MSKNQKQLIVLAVLLVIAVVAYMYSRNDVPGFQGVSQADTSHFTPLDVQPPDLRLDLLAKIHKEEYNGTNRDIFSSSSPPPVAGNGPNKGLGPNTGHILARRRGDPFPMVPPPPPPAPPVQVPGQFFGFASRHSGKKVAFFLRDEDVTVVTEGDAFYSNYRLIHIGNDSAEVEEISSGRHTTVPLEQAPDLAANQANPGNPQ